MPTESQILANRATSHEIQAMPNFLNSKELNSAGFTRPKPASRELRSTLVERTLQFHPFFAKRTQFPKSQVSTKYYTARTCENWTIGEIGKTNPKRTQYEPNSKPIRTQFEAKRSQSNPISARYFWVTEENQKLKIKMQN